MNHINFHFHDPTHPQGNTVRWSLDATIDVIYHLQLPDGVEQETGNHELKFNVGSVLLVLYPAADAPMT